MKAKKVFPVVVASGDLEVLSPAGMRATPKDVQDSEANRRYGHLLIEGGNDAMDNEKL
jgi:hypothetical protein